MDGGNLASPQRPEKYKTAISYAGLYRIVDLQIIPYSITLLYYQYNIHTLRKFQVGNFPHVSLTPPLSTPR